MSKFKVGDRVRYKHNDGPWLERQLGSDSVGVVVSEKGDLSDYHNYESVNVQFGITEDVDIEDLELVEPTDRKTAFLEELRELMIRHNASIEITEDFPDSAYIKFNIGNESVSYEDLGLTEVGGVNREIITSDNTMSYDKEGV